MELMDVFLFVQCRGYVLSRGGDVDGVVEVRGEEDGEAIIHVTISLHDGAWFSIVSLSIRC